MIRDERQTRVPDLSVWRHGGGAPWGTTSARVTLYQDLTGPSSPIRSRIGQAVFDGRLEPPEVLVRGVEILQPMLIILLPRTERGGERLNLMKLQTELPTSSAPIECFVALELLEDETWALTPILRGDAPEDHNATVVEVNRMVQIDVHFNSFHCAHRAISL